MNGGMFEIMIFFEGVLSGITLQKCLTKWRRLTGTQNSAYQSEMAPIMEFDVD